MTTLQSTLPLVRIVIPAYNAGKTLPATINSALAQRYPAIEVVVVDDGSTDDTPAVLEAFGDRIRVVHQPNAGLPAARDAGHRASHGALIAWLDADDLMEPDRVALQVEFLLQHPSVVLVSTEFSAFREGSPDAHRFADVYYTRIGEAGGLEAVYGSRASLTPVQYHWQALWHH
jgi:glycosyltransferase involved in cell wall biosynthesis